MKPAPPRPAPPLVLFEDDHLLAIHKPAAWNTHAPAPHAGEGVYDWLRHREPRWATLAIIHRLDKDTSGVLVFAKSPAANRSLTAQFTERTVHKRYLLITDRPPPSPPDSPAPGTFTIRSHLRRVGDHYQGGPAASGGDPAETRFRLLESAPGRFLLEAEPVTGRTHQIRVHAAEAGFPILGDTLYGGTPAARVHLHAASLELRHPVTDAPLTFHAPPDFAADPRMALRRAFIEEPAPDRPGTNAFRWSHGTADGAPGWYVDRLGDYLLSQSAEPLTPAQLDTLAAWLRQAGPTPLRGAYHKILDRHVRQAGAAQASPRLVLGDPAPDRFEILENGVRFELSFAEGYSVGLFLDQRDNRRRCRTGHVAAGFELFPANPDPGRAPEVLNTFAYTCGFSVCAALAGARTVSLDLSRKYLDWGRRNFTLNGLDPAGHDFIYGDTFDWLRRLAKKGRAFDVILLDPPTFSQSKESGVFRAEKDYGRLVTAALPVLKPGGVLFASTNAATLTPDDFIATVEAALRAARRPSTRRHYVPQPPDFPITRDEPAHLKTLWTQVT